MAQRSSIYWDSPETAERARLMAEAEDTNISRLVSDLINGKYEREYPEPPIEAICPTCRKPTTFVFLAYWREQSDLYRCVECRTALQKDAIVGEPIPV